MNDKNHLTEGPVTKKLISLATPMVFGMLSMVVFNLALAAIGVVLVLLLLLPTDMVVGLALPPAPCVPHSFAVTASSNSSLFFFCVCVLLPLRGAVLLPGLCSCSCPCASLWWT